MNEDDPKCDPECSDHEKCEKADPKKAETKNKCVSDGSEGGMKIPV